ncbi:unnamed protein product [Schistosoma turkestanicum]|nr:unnamed protein product [Schistosoma turkestanicum]
MGNCMKSSNLKEINPHLNNEELLASPHYVQLCKDFHTHEDIIKLISIITGNSNELCQCILKDGEELDNLKRDIVTFLEKHCLDRCHFPLNDDPLHSVKWDPNLTNDQENEKTGHPTNATGSRLYKSTLWPLISTHILGFTVLKSNLLNCIEWLEYSEYERHTKVPYDQVSIFRTDQTTTTTTNDDDDSNVPNDENDTGLNKVNDTGDDDDNTERLCYTMFICQAKWDAMKFLKIFQSIKNVMHSLEIRTGCKIRLSKCLFMYKGNPVRILVIDGPSKEQIVQCYTSLPQWVTRMLILESERPNAR